MFWTFFSYLSNMTWLILPYEPLSHIPYSIYMKLVEVKGDIETLFCNMWHNSISSYLWWSICCCFLNLFPTCLTSERSYHSLLWILGWSWTRRKARYSSIDAAEIKQKWTERDPGTWWRGFASWILRHPSINPRNHLPGLPATRWNFQSKKSPTKTASYSLKLAAR